MLTNNNLRFHQLNFFFIFITYFIILKNREIVIF